MVISADTVALTFLPDFESDDWSAVLKAVAAADAWIQGATPGHPSIDTVVLGLATLARHPKWEIRRAVAQVAARSPHPAFEPALVKLAVDDNARVRQAAEQATIRRRDHRQASAYGRQHEDRINAILDDIEVRFGNRGREAVKRAAADIANSFVRELYHEVIKLVTPLTIWADQLQQRLAGDATVSENVREEISRIERQVQHLRAVLDSMRSFTATPSLRFERESLREIAEEAARVAHPFRMGTSVPTIDVLVPPGITVEVARTRLVQALTNVVTNAVEACEGIHLTPPVRIIGEEREGHVALVIEDFGCGMSKEATIDARALFATSKPHGTGFGLPLAIKIVESEHRGRLSIESEKGRGTRVEILLPKAQGTHL